MKEKDEHFWIEDVINRLPNELVPDVKDWPSLLSALTKLKTERNNAVVERNELAAQVERLRGAANNLSFGLVHDDDWNPSDHTDKAFSELQDIISETPAKSLDAVKREWKSEFLELAVEKADDNLSGWLAVAIDDLERL